MGLTSEEIALILPFSLIFVMAIFVASLLLYYYRITKVFDYFLISVTFVCGAFYNLFLAFFKINRPIQSLLFHIQIMHFLFLSIQFLFFIYAIRVKWYRPPRVVFIMGLISYLILVLMISQYQLIELPDKTTWGGLHLQKTEDEETGGGFQTNSGTILLGWGFDLFISLYRIFTFCFIIYIYITLEFDIDRELIKKPRRLWLIAQFLYLLPELIKVPYHLSLYFLPNVRLIVSFITLLALIVVSYIAIKYSEALLLSSIQLLRASKLYNLVKNEEINKENVFFGMKGLIDYIGNVTLGFKDR